MFASDSQNYRQTQQLVQIILLKNTGVKSGEKPEYATRQNFCSLIKNVFRPTFPAFSLKKPYEQ